MSLYADYYAKRLERLLLQRQADKLEQEEKDILYDIQKEMVANGKTEATIDGFLVQCEPKDAASVQSWPDLLEFIRESGAVDLLQKRVTESAVKARWDAGVDLPGVSKVTKYKVTVTQE